MEDWQGDARLPKGICILFQHVVNELGMRWGLFIACKSFG